MTTQASPGLNIAGPADATPGISGIPGIPPGSVMAAMSAGILRRNVQLTGWGISPGANLAAGTHPNPTLAALASDAGQHGTHPLVTTNGGSPTIQACGGSGPGPVNTVQGPGGAGPGTILTVPASMPGSSLTFLSPPSYGG